MPTSITLAGVKTHETCPECGEPDVLVEHGYDEHGPLHLWYCHGDGCENDGIVIVVGPCEHCRPAGQPEVGAGGEISPTRISLAGEER